MLVLLARVKQHNAVELRNTHNHTCLPSLSSRPLVTGVRSDREAHRTCRLLLRVGPFNRLLLVVRQVTMMYVR